jgi:hypothetical protein
MGTNRTGLGAAFRPDDLPPWGWTALTSPESNETAGEQTLVATSKQVASMGATLSHRHESVWEGESMRRRNFLPRTNWGKWNRETGKRLPTVKETNPQMRRSPAL